MSSAYNNNLAYAVNAPSLNVFNPPIVGKRAPTVNDIGWQLGQIWIYNSLAYILVNVAAGVATWSLLEASSGAGIFASLVVTPGPTSITGTTGINTSGAGVTTINTGGTGALHLGNATGNTAVTGSLSTTTSLSATTTITAGTGITATTGNIAASSGNVSASGTVTGGTGVVATTGNVTVSDGNLVLSTAATYISMPGPVFIYSGSGAPASGLALHVGDLYINSSAATTTTRLYIATAAGTWTYFTSNA